MKQVLRTKDYSMFHFIKGNRKIDKNHIARMTKVIMNNNMLAENEIIVNEAMGIIDGQHRFIVARDNGLEISYKIKNGAGLTEVLELNANRKNWSAEDYLMSYVELGNVHYIYLKDFTQQYGVSITVAVELLSGGYKWSSTWGKFKSGDFEPIYRDSAEIIADGMVTVKPYVEPSAWKDRDFIRAFKKSLETVAVEDMVKKFQVSGWIIDKKNSQKDYIRAIEDVVNWKSRGEILRLM